MKLYKNVDIKDLKNILSEGILPISKTNNNNWDSGKRADNSSDVVYLFSSVSSQNSFPRYGVALVEVSVEATENIIANNDANSGEYIEYIAEEVAPANILKVYIPEIFKSYINAELLEAVKVTWVELTAEVYGENVLENADQELLRQFAKTAPLSTSEFNFFRGVKENKEMFNLYNINYAL